MSDGLSIAVDIVGVERALNDLGAFAQTYVNAASRVSADALVREMQVRLRRQLGPHATGQTAEGIMNQPAYDGNGYVVMSDNPRMPNLPLWIEKGTKRGDPGSHTAAARPYFYAAARVEQGAHERRIADALQQAIDAKGLGAS